MGILADLRDRRMRRRESMECRAAVELVTDYLEGALDDAMRARFEAHVRGCEGCVAYVAQMRATVAALADVPTDGIDPAVREELLTLYRRYRDR